MGRPTGPGVVSWAGGACRGRIGCWAGCLIAGWGPGGMGRRGRVCGPGWAGGWGSCRGPVGRRWVLGGAGVCGVWAGRRGCSTGPGAGAAGWLSAVGAVAVAPVAGAPSGAVAVGRVRMRCGPRVAGACWPARGAHGAAGCAGRRMGPWRGSRPPLAAPVAGSGGAGAYGGRGRGRLPRPGGAGTPGRLRGVRRGRWAVCGPGPGIGGAGILGEAPTGGRAARFGGGRP